MPYVPHTYAPMWQFQRYTTNHSIFIGGTKSNLLFTRPTPIIDQGGHAYTYTLTVIPRYAKSPMGFPGGPLIRRSASPSVRQSGALGLMRVSLYSKYRFGL